MKGLRVVWLDVEGFRRLSARSFFDLRDPRGDVGEQLVVAGTNGGGKTTLLEAVLFGLGREDLIGQDQPKEERGRGRAAFPAGARVSICVQLDGRLLRSDRTNGKGVWHEVSGPFAAPGAAVPEGLGSAQVEYFSAWRAPKLNGPVWPSGRGRKPQVTEANRLWNLKQRLIDRRVHRSYVGAQGTDPWLDQINAAWATLHRDGTRLADQAVDPNDAEAGSDLFVVEEDGTRRCSVDHVSAGEIEFLCMAGMLTTEDFRGVLLIDEPELHLHPEWQAQILPALRKLAPGAQILATTHAAAPWDRAYSYQRYFLAPVGDPRRSDLAVPAELVWRATPVGSTGRTVKCEVAGS